MKTKWYRTDEKENTIDYLEAAAVFLATEQEHKWKWLTIALHGALYGSALLAIQGTDPDRVRKERRVISLWQALERCQGDEYMLQNVGSRRLAVSDSERSSINKLSSGLRNRFEHFTPTHWSIEVSGAPRHREWCL